MVGEQSLAAPGPEALDPVWTQLRREAEDVVEREPALAGFIYSSILNHKSLEEAVAYRVSERLRHSSLPGGQLVRAFAEMYADRPDLCETLRIDLVAVYDRDPACERFIEPVLYFKGFHAIQAQRLGHWMWERGHKDFGLYLQSRVSEVFQVDIHPAVPMGRGIFIDHATGIVVGMTAVIEDDVSILQNVTLGGTGKDCGDRHPKIRHGVLIGAGAKVLGNIEIGQCSRVAAGSVVLKPVPPMTTVAGVPARVVGEAGRGEPSRTMDQLLRDAAENGEL
ncbi:serine O-acetyltransferase [Afifella sp. IM 167]|uniref:serine O-acetyltransferase n=1 Tax=Afifella sp. IM 167 TaxID=2033586 RepID=UPI001CC9FB7A|nr:serine O-acetyltransferase [Afifella sp. IM 167]MBZ8134634.1 serine O-acetyltransferase [Afifella sp. IM 167]